MKLPKTFSHLLEGTMRLPKSFSHLLEEVSHLADHTLLLHDLRVAPVSVGEEVVPQHRCVDQCLDNTVHETSVA